MHIQHNIIIPKQYKGNRLDQAIADLLPEYSRSMIKKWIQSGELKVDHKISRPRYKIIGNETVSIDAQITENQGIQAENIDLNIVYEDDDILILNKPAGITVHPGAGISSHTLLNAILHHVPLISQIPRYGIVHRIDKDTSGLLIIAKTLTAHTRLTHAIQRHKVSREYKAIVNSTFTAGGTIDAPIGRHPKFRTRMAVVDSGRNAVTHYRILERFKNFTLLTIQLETGRTHQIRVHMAYIHHSIVGDPVYNGRILIPKGASDNLIYAIQQFKRQALHAFKLSFIHPTTKKALSFEIDIPEDMQNLLKILRKENLL